ncbi:MAG: HAMP domain-containing histidine kinase [Candidatus Omnitrophica bacterium]|nr:HAMP domain-containing histidine kinase [Candidatus Omnitrophota bacterium]MDE2009980.1 HAMP domain-containing histidine kinase [Candidatus Omnitrophota bacterium]MDE2213958.1 HAMP domain-containing histidine kinase [Candidatus Omnitrophota bacterium]MDE2231892.1 HAMP domain-containing histidine kinase [Candidatus Omnitrophota bacterium]
MRNNPQTSDSFTLISGLAHELDSPLKSILARTRKLINDYKSRDFEFISYKDFKVIIATLEQIERQLEHCSQTTSRMMFVGKRQALLGENNCRINDIIRSVINEMGRQLESSRIKLTARLGKDLPKVTVGPIECHQIIHNVIINAVQAMPGGGTIKVKTSLDKAYGLVDIDVTDEGVGITPDHLPKVFEPFFTTKERGVEKSAGLGLSIIYSIINAAGGSIHIKSSLRKGTTVQISLPVYKSK